ncbi:MAG: VCBS repeat-containing protein [Planctomycetes bacterium]|nr:VCBS repeat-containing protein [Planctomycetota bacterium]
MNVSLPLFSLFLATSAFSQQTSVWHSRQQWDGVDSFECLGISAKAVGDLDGDGISDFVGGTRNLHAYTFSGGTGLPLHSLQSPSSSNGFGQAVLGVPDLNGDGVPEYLISAPHATAKGILDCGTVTIISGASGNRIRRLFGSIPGELFGTSLAHCPDLDGDGVAEIIVGSPGHRNSKGMVRFFSGASGDMIKKIPGLEAQSEFGLCLSLLGDVDGDSFLDLAIGAPGTSNSNGSVHITSIPSGIFQPAILGTQAGARFGQSISSISDINGDGLPDILIGAPLSSANRFIENGLLHAYSPANSSDIWTKSGARDGDWFGSAVTTLNDLDGDGLAETLVGAPRGSWPNGTVTGYTSVLSGDGSTVIRRDFGDKVRDYFGSAVLGLGDIDGDLIPDFIVGSHESDAKGTRKYDTGSAYMISTANGRYEQFDGAHAGDRDCFSLAKIHDLNGDGVHEILVGALFAPATIRDGVTGVVLRSHEGGNYGDDFGRFTFECGDIDQDGRADFAVGAYTGDPGGLTGAGSMHFFSGDTGLQVSQIDGQKSFESIGPSLARLGDIDGDGIDDVAVGGPLDSPNGVFEAGVVRAYSTCLGNLLWTTAGRSANDRLGNALAAVGDLNQDGYTDLVASAYLADPQGMEAAGQVLILDGKDGNILATIDGEASKDYFGYAVVVLGDATGDGILNFAVGAKYADPNGKNEAGSVYLYSADTFALIHRFDGEFEGDYFGNALAAGGDFDGDGLPDLLVGAKYADPQGLNNAGQVQVFNCSVREEITRIEGTMANAEFGYSLDSGFDLDQDGHPDVIVGAASASTVNDSCGALYTYTWEPNFQITTTPLIGGRNAKISVRGGTPNRVYYLAYSLQGPGPTQTSVGLLSLTDPIKILHAERLDQNGHGVLKLPIPNGYAGLHIWLQAYDRKSNTLSDGIHRVLR